MKWIGANQAEKPKSQEPAAPIPLPRITLPTPIPIRQIRSPVGPALFFGYAINLTREGLFIPTINPKPVGFKTRVEFFLPKSQVAIGGEVEVIWVRDYDSKKTQPPAGMGIKFLDLKESQKKLIDQFMSRCSGVVIRI